MAGFCVFKDHGDYCLYAPIPLDQIEREENAKTERQAIMARGKELDRKARGFEAIARDTRFAWMRTNLHTLTREQTVAGICELAIAETVGWHSMFVSRPIHGEGVVEALIGFGWNLPITEHDDEHWSLECRENLDSIRMVLRDRPLRILDGPGRQMGVEHRLELLALAAWRGRYVLLVRRAGTYRISGQRGREEGAQGAYLDGGDDES